MSSVFAEDIFQEKVYIRGQAMLASDVLQEAERQLDIRLVNKAKDAFAYRKDYDDAVTFAQLLEAVQAYYQKYNGITLLLKTPGKGRYVLVQDKIDVVHEEDHVAVEDKDDLNPTTEDDLATGLADSRGDVDVDLLATLDGPEDVGLDEPQFFRVSDLEHDLSSQLAVVEEGSVSLDGVAQPELPAAEIVHRPVGVEQGVIVERPAVEMAWLNFPRLELPDLYSAMDRVSRRMSDADQMSGQSLNVEVLGLYRDAPQVKKIGPKKDQFGLSLGSSEPTSKNKETLLSMSQLRAEWLDELSWRWVTEKPSLTPLMVSTLGFSDGFGPEGLCGSLFYQRQHGDDGGDSVRIDQLLFSGAWNHDFLDQGWACSVSSGLVLGKSQFLGAKAAESRIALRDLEFAARFPVDLWEDDLVMFWGPRFKIPSFDNELVNARSVEAALDLVSTFPWQNYIVSSNWSFFRRADSALLGEAKEFSLTSSIAVGRELSGGYLEFGYYYSSGVYESRLGGAHHFFKMSYKGLSSLPLELTLYLGANAAMDGMDLALVPQSL